MEETSKIRVIVGLGNEGEEYQKTYHNVGAFLATHLQQMHTFPESQFFHLTGFMNTIGIPVRHFLGKKNVQPAEALVIHDEADLPVGEYKLSFGGGSAGHKGVHSIVEQCGTEQFWRLRIGVRDPNEVVRRKAEAFVLHQWSAADEQAFLRTLEKAQQEMKEKKLV